MFKLGLGPRSWNLGLEAGISAGGVGGGGEISQNVKAKVIGSYWAAAQNDQIIP